MRTFSNYVQLKKRRLFSDRPYINISPKYELILVWYAGCDEASPEMKNRSVKLSPF